MQPFAFLVLMSIINIFTVASSLDNAATTLQTVLINGQNPSSVPSVATYFAATRKNTPVPTSVRFPLRIPSNSSGLKPLFAPPIRSGFYELADRVEQQTNKTSLNLPVVTKHKPSKTVTATLTTVYPCPIETGFCTYTSTVTYCMHDPGSSPFPCPETPAPKLQTTFNTQYTQPTQSHSNDAIPPSSFFSILSIIRALIL